MGEHVLRLLWQHEGEVLLVDEVACRTREEASRLFHRLSEMLRALVAVERRLEGRE